MRDLNDIYGKEVDSGDEQGEQSPPEYGEEEEAQPRDDIDGDALEEMLASGSRVPFDSSTPSNDKSLQARTMKQAGAQKTKATPSPSSSAKPTIKPLFG